MADTERNVKIKIHESDFTGGTAAIESTDIAYVPGFSSKTDAPSVPTLVTSVYEFESLFGTEPAKIDTDSDKSYAYAHSLLEQGMYVLYDALSMSEDTTSFASVIATELSNRLELLEDKNEYPVKYITTGGYPVMSVASDAVNADLAYDMMELAQKRGDAVALLDFDSSSKEMPLYGEGSIYSAANAEFTQKDADVLSFGAIMHPWATYDCGEMPASFGYLMCVAKAIKTSPNWLAMAGVARGLVPTIKNLETGSYVLTNTVAENMQPYQGADGNNIAINCITNIKPYGLAVWGNRTLKPLEGGARPAGTCYLNTRNMISDIKKNLYVTAKSLMFEQNTDTLWLRFKSGVSSLLNQLKSGNGISDYKILKESTTERDVIKAVVKVYPIKAVEYFEITVEIRDDDVAVSNS